MPTEIEDRMKAIASLIERLAHYEKEIALCEIGNLPLIRQSSLIQAGEVRKKLREFGIPVLRGTIEAKNGVG